MESVCVCECVDMENKMLTVHRITQQRKRVVFQYKLDDLDLEILHS